MVRNVTGQPGDVSAAVDIGTTIPNATTEMTAAARTRWSSNDNPLPH
jgi:hypothetical protein